jgi:glycosyltransferase involved in cell wall biosynthesis
MKKYRNVYLELMGGIEQDAVAELFRNMDDSNLDRISIIGGTKSWTGYPELLSKQKWDIGIAPLIDDVFNRGKSHIKWMEYASYKIPTVASNVYPYYKDIQGTKTIEDGVTGYLCEPKEWYEKLEKLVLDNNLRNRIGENAYYYVKDNWQPQHHIKKWKEAIDTLLKI